jgi:hypothetical protein
MNDEGRRMKPIHNDAFGMGWIPGLDRIAPASGRSGPGTG